MSDDDSQDAKKAERGGLSTTLPALLDGDSDERFRAFVHDLFALTSSVDDILRRHANFVKLKYEIRLSPSAITVLTAAARLNRHGPVLTKQLASYLRVTPSFISMAMNELVGAQMVEKRASERDLRVKYFELTDLAWETLEKTDAEKRVVNDTLFQGLGREDFNELARLVHLLVDNAELAVSKYAQMEMEFEREQRSDSIQANRVS